MVRQISAACRVQTVPAATAAATFVNRAGKRCPDIARRGARSTATRTPLGRLPPGDPQPLAQQHRRGRVPQLGRHSTRIHLGDQGVRDRGSLPRVDLQHGHQLQQLITTQRGRINGAQRLPRRYQLSQRAPRPNRGLSTTCSILADRSVGQSRIHRHSTPFYSNESRTQPYIRVPRISFAEFLRRLRH